MLETLHDHPKRYANRELFKEVQNYYKKNRHNIKNDIPYENNCGIDEWIDEYWLMNCNHTYTVK